MKFRKLSIILMLLFIISSILNCKKDSKPLNYNAAIINIISPSVSSCYGLQDIQITLKNYSSTTLNNLVIDWFVNGKKQKYISNGDLNIKENSTKIIIIGNYNFHIDSTYAINVKISMPNGNVDSDTSNNSYTLNNIIVDSQLSCEKVKVLNDYKNIYLSGNTYTINWTGNTANCLAGSVSNDIQNQTFQRINYFRNLVGLPSITNFSSDKNAKCQLGALMLNANNTLNHTPPPTWSCFTSDGYEATSHSNIAMGMVGPSAITGYMNDFGSSNTACGHRRWILYPRMKIMGHGNTNSYDCLMTLSEVSGDYTATYPANMPEFISWPPKNYVPSALVFARWSFSIPSADFTNTAITMTDALNANVSLNIVSSTANGFGDNTIIWEPAGINLSSSSDVTYNVKVNNVLVGGKTMNYSYSVVIIQTNGLKKAEVSENNSKIF